MNAAARPRGFEDYRYMGDKRSQTVYDLDSCSRPDLIDEVVDAEAFIAFAPDNLAEARNRGYKLSRHCRRPDS